MEKLVEKLQLDIDKRAANDPIIKKSLSVVREFLKNNRVLCYGGTAINDLLPSADKFYKDDRTTPDYDFFSTNPQETAVKLADILAKDKSMSVEVKPGVHFGTFKIFANFEGVADITQLDKAVFDRLWDENVTKGGIHYVTPNFLRMSMYLELSRPRGDVSRWGKIYERLNLLNTHYPIACKMPDTEPAELDDKHRAKIQHILKTHPVILLGITASQILGRSKVKWSAPVSLLADAEVANKILTGFSNITRHPPTDILPAYSEVIEDKKTIIRIYETTACHSYHTSGGIRVASVPTALQFFFASIYSGAPEDDIGQIICVIQRLVDITNKKPGRRFASLIPISCVGEQKTLQEVRRDRADLFKTLSRKKSSVDFLRYFFTYSPHESATRRQQKKDLLRKTRKDRLY
jgi:hypothetical protein